MKRFIVAALFTFLVAPSHLTMAQDAKSAPAAEAAAPLSEAEKKFKELLTNVTMDGRWSSVENGVMGPEKQDKYNIVSVAKVKGDSWVISAKVKYNDREMVLPLPVEVKWAGDTAVLIVNNLAFPGGGTYNARVLFYEKTYAGSWTGGTRGGLISGTISPNKN